MQWSVPKLELGLTRKPSLADQEAENDAGLVFFATGFAGAFYDGGGDYGGVCGGDPAFVEFAGDYLFDLVFEAEGYAHDLFRGD